MVTLDGKIVECTEAELFSYWLSREFDDVMSYPAYRAGCAAAGTKIVENEGERCESER